MAVTNSLSFYSRFLRSRLCPTALRHISWGIFITLSFFSQPLLAAVLPEDQTEVLYHRYEGGGMEIHGPSVLVRKQFADKVSVWGNYYVDLLSGASIDVLTSGSTFYEEERQEGSAGVDYLHERTILSANVTRSIEDDYDALTVGFGLSQEFFGDLTTLSMNFSQGDDEVRRNIAEGETEDVGEATHKRFGIGLTQVITRSWIAAMNVESVIDEGFLNNPYRSVRSVSRSDPEVSESQFELYPSTRNSDAISLRTMIYLPYRAALRLEGRAYQDSWDIKSENYEIRYIHPWQTQWIFEAKVRFYKQNQANFYSDLFEFPDDERVEFRARDKELSDYTNTSFGLGVSYTIEKEVFTWLDDLSVNAYVDHMRFDYDNFLDASGDNTAVFGLGNEPKYRFNATVLRLFLSAKY